MRDQIEMGEGMLNHYIFTYKDEPFVALATEQEFEVEIPRTKGGMLVGTVDGIIQDHKSRIWLIEHKTFSLEPPPEFLVLDRQTTLYHWACQRLIEQGYFKDFGIAPHEKLHGILYNGLRKKVPVCPRLLKTGGISQAMNMDTTYEVYMDTLQFYKLDPAPYAATLTRLKNKPNKFFKREWIQRGPPELRSAETQLQAIYERMNNPGAIYPNPTWDCSWRCDYKNLCCAEQTGVHTDFMREHEYINAPKRGKVYA